MWVQCALMQILIDKQADYEEWKAKNADAYGAECFRYAEAWADIMEKRLAKEESLAVFAKETSHEANTHGITAFMYGMAVFILGKFWVHGEELRRWHNLDVQIGDEGEAANGSGETLMPAVLSCSQ